MYRPSSSCSAASALAAATRAASLASASRWWATRLTSRRTSQKMESGSLGVWQWTQLPAARLAATRAATRCQLVTPHEVDLCKQRMNTFAYVGDLKTGPEVACVYHSEEAENQYLQVLGSRQQMTQMLLQQPPAPPAAQPT
ncbi:hypothetical protein TSOC_003999 [Tetrabaena socialis]|uniref:Uncharacterized protein n=1 Tax=Tetrabaena socialis TaxID=47790 RepID=A0A2J8AA61_9CHLO|nr:hypothetical protein TSOC_003999 [Tetrabaena socialis]|eukprot:PNH09412.1 hypothetical protein TSOC_003999 [Tetrabaena socialis]